MERHYSVTMQTGDHTLTVNVFTPGEVTPAELKPLAIRRGIEFSKEMGQNVNESDIKLIGYVDKGWFPF